MILFLHVLSDQSTTSKKINSCTNLQSSVAAGLFFCEFLKLFNSAFDLHFLFRLTFWKTISVFLGYYFVKKNSVYFFRL
nr:MAG TPA: hypothetical protein [Caudoviricetes sp.]